MAQDVCIHLTGTEMTKGGNQILMFFFGKIAERLFLTQI